MARCAQSPLNTPHACAVRRAQSVLHALSSLLAKSRCLTFCWVGGRAGSVGRGRCSLVLGLGFYPYASCLRQTCGASSHDRSPPMVPWTDPPRQRPDMHEQLSHSVWSTPSPSQMEDVCSLQPPPFETPSGKLQRLMAMRNAAHTKWESPSPGISRGPAPGP